MKSASERPCAVSLPTTREKVGYFPCVSVAFVADAEMYGRVFRLNSGPTAITSWDPAGPTVTSKELVGGELRADGQRELRVELSIALAST